METHIRTVHSVALQADRCRKETQYPTPYQTSVKRYTPTNTGTCVAVGRADEGRVQLDEALVVRAVEPATPPGVDASTREVVGFSGSVGDD